MKENIKQALDDSASQFKSPKDAIRFHLKVALMQLHMNYDGAFADQLGSKISSCIEDTKDVWPVEDLKVTKPVEHKRSILMDPERTILTEPVLDVSDPNNAKELENRALESLESGNYGGPFELKEDAQYSTAGIPASEDFNNDTVIDETTTAADAILRYPAEVALNRQRILDEIGFMPVKDKKLGLQNRVVIVLHEHMIFDINALVNYTGQELLALNRFGRVMLLDVIERLRNVGLELAVSTYAKGHREPKKQHKGDKSNLIGTAQ
jgi:hypothetical protein